MVKWYWNRGKCW